MKFTEQELQSATQEMRARGLPTMSAWATKMNPIVRMTPDTIRHNERLHAHDYLVAQAASDK